MLHKKPRAFRSEVGKIGSLSGKQKQQKKALKGGTAVLLGARAVPCLWLWG